MCDICDSALITDEIVITGIFEMLLKDSVQPLQLILISIGSVLVVLRCVANELFELSADCLRAIMQ